VFRRMSSGRLGDQSTTLANRNGHLKNATIWPTSDLYLKGICGRGSRLLWEALDSRRIEHHQLLTLDHRRSLCPRRPARWTDGSGIVNLRNASMCVAASVNSIVSLRKTWPSPLRAGYAISSQYEFGTRRREC